MQDSVKTANPEFLYVLNVRIYEFTFWTWSHAVSRSERWMAITDEGPLMVFLCSLHFSSGLLHFTPSISFRRRRAQKESCQPETENGYWLYRVILSVLDPRKCEYLKDYSLDFEHA